MRMLLNSLFIVLALLPGAVYAAVPATSLLPQNAFITARWNFDEASGTRVDFVGINDLTDNNTVGSVACQFSLNCADFEFDNSEWLSIVDNSDVSPTGDFTVAFWYNAESLSASGGDRMFFSKNNGSSQRSIYFSLHNTGGNPVYRLSISPNLTSDNAQDHTVLTAPNLSTWYHLVLVFDASAGTATYYVDGVQDGSPVGSYATSIPDSTASWEIGGYAAGSLEFDGLMQDFIYWKDVAITSADVDDLFECYSGSGCVDGGGGSGSGFVASGNLDGSGSLIIGHAACSVFEGTVCTYWDFALEIPFVKTYYEGFNKLIGDWSQVWWWYIFFAFMVLSGISFIWSSMRRK